MFKKFFMYTEIKTKITSLFAFLMSLAYLFYIKNPIRLDLTLIFFFAMFLFDLTTTAINNYIDSKDHPHMLPFSRRMGRILIWLLFLTSAGMGLYLARCTDVTVLLLGGLCFLCGVFYTYGPVPISRQPLGELLSGLFYGIFIPFLLLYINMPKGTYLTLQFDLAEINLTLKVLPLLTLLLLAVPPFCTTANIMLANNTCDLEADILVKRFTLPYYLGKERAVNLFATLYLAAYIAPCILVLGGLLHPVTLLLLLTVPRCLRNIQIFREEQVKDKTFIVSIKNYVLIMASYSFVLFLGGLLERIFTNV